VVGLGRTRRILLYDTLAAGFRPEEIEAVLPTSWPPRQATCGAACSARRAERRDLLGRESRAERRRRPLRLRGRRRSRRLPWLMLVLAALGLVPTPLVNAFSRYVERQADDFALALTATRTASSAPRSLPR